MADVEGLLTLMTALAGSIQSDGDTCYNNKNNAAKVKKNYRKNEIWYGFIYSLDQSFSAFAS